MTANNKEVLSKDMANEVIRKLKAMLKATEERNIELTKEKDIAILRSMEKE